MNYIEYKTVARVQLFGISDMLKNDASSVSIMSDYHRMQN